MIYSIYIITENGVCVFTKHYKKSLVDDQLISGFMSALGNFSIEALGSELQSIKLRTGEQLSVLKHYKQSIIGVVLADPRDHPNLISSLLTAILNEFLIDYERPIIAKDPSLIGKTGDFDEKIDKLLKGKVASRTFLKMIVGNILSFSLMLAITILMIGGAMRLSVLVDDFLVTLSPIDFAELNAEELATLQAITGAIIAVLMIFFIGTFFLPSLLSGYIAGNEKRGIVNAILLGLITGVLLFIGGSRATGQLNIFWWYLLFSPLLIFIAITCGFYGGRLKARRKLYPLKKNLT